MSENKRVTIPFLVKVLQPIVDLIRTKADKTDMVQSDWNQADETKNDFIKNKPTDLVHASDIPAIDASLSTEGAAADAKVVGDILATKADILTDDDALELAAELGLINPTTDENGAIYTDINGEILSL